MDLSLSIILVWLPPRRAVVIHFQWLLPSSVPADFDGVLGSPKSPTSGATAMDTFFNAGGSSASGAKSTNAVKNVGESHGVVDFNGETSFTSDGFDNLTLHCCPEHGQRGDGPLAQAAAIATRSVLHKCSGEQ